jgi:hypothetical protein
VNGIVRRVLIWIAAAIGLVAVMGALAWAFSQTWAEGGIDLGLHGWISLTIALVGTTVVAGGLMWLAFYSARSGWDDIDRDNP